MAIIHYIKQFQTHYYHGRDHLLGTNTHTVYIIYILNHLVNQLILEKVKIYDFVAQGHLFEKPASNCPIDRA